MSDSASSGGESQQGARLEQAREHWKQCKAVVTAVQAFAPLAILTILKQQVSEAKVVLDKLKPPAERLQALKDSERAKEARVAQLVEQHEKAQAAVAAAAARLGAAKASLADTRHLIDRVRHAVNEEAAATAATATAPPATSAPGQQIVGSVHDFASAERALQDLENCRNQIGAMMAAAVVAGVPMAAAAATAETATLAADDRELKRLRAELTAAEAKAKGGTEPVDLKAKGGTEQAELSQAESASSVLS
jgi:hypothetical protein